jgi:hypothetical protein
VDRTILPATVGEDASAAAGVAVVRVRERQERNPELNPVHHPVHHPESHPEHNHLHNQQPQPHGPPTGQERPIALHHRLLKESLQVKGSQQ